MDRFLCIDWHCPLEDLIDATFINGERLEKESVMHKIMTGNFVDPFKNIEEDYKNIELNLLKDIDPDIKEEINNDNEIIVKQKWDCEHEDTQKVKAYVPGIVKAIFKFPKKSKLDKEQQAMCLRVLLRFSESDKPKITKAQREELQKYLDLQQIISQEQDEFLEFAKSKWTERSFKIKCEDFINLHWKLKLQHIYKLPRYYTEVTTIPFVTDKNIEVQFISNCLELGTLQEIILPTFTRPYMLRVNSKQLQKTYFPKKNTFQKSSASFKLPVSEDVNCQKLAEDNNVDLVISSSGLNCLVNNIGPTYPNSWILPIVIKKHNDKNVIYIDKPGPPVANTIPEKNTWVYKYILKYYFSSIKNSTLKNENIEEDNIFGDIHSEKLLKIEEEYENISTECNNEITSNVSEKNRNFEEISTQKNIGNNDNVSANEGKNICCISFISLKHKDTTNKSFETTEDRISYNLFSIGPQPTEQNNLMKNIKKYRILVRTKIHGFEILENKEKRLLILTPKLEHQPDLGAEAVTLEEALKQWISLIFRPHTFLARVRISSKTSEMLQIEYRTAMSIRNEIQRLYNMKVEDSLVTLHNVIQSLTNLSPGRYLMRHTIRNGAFIAVSKPVENPGKNIFDMHTLYSEKFHTLLNSPWITLDKTLPTPMLKCFERMPAMFHPVNKRTFANKKGNTSATGVIRRSLRNKKKK
ncbi:PREDICTED: uncharacterized protein LOC108550120 [Eufriesea mexicana]|uniref:uncharacterized protein LOC108550120 n=1 Tax=Eufriesea mexicana TaxID=516756 RepID=UPI00083C3B1C|nr:PREDICTED: uncharacterized protein LOC108550120 [Eufriesea mexicana]